jgi:hypothetical protein
MGLMMMVRMGMMMVMGMMMMVMIFKLIQVLVIFPVSKNPLTSYYLLNENEKHALIYMCMHTSMIIGLYMNIIYWWL